MVIYIYILIYTVCHASDRKLFVLSTLKIGYDILQYGTAENRIFLTANIPPIQYIDLNHLFVKIIHYKKNTTLKPNNNNNNIEKSNYPEPVL